MKKSYKIIIICISIIIGTLMIIDKLGFLKIYSNPTTANEPNLKLNSRMFVTNLKEPKKGDFVCYKFYDTIFGLGEHIRVHRLCATGKDQIELKNGILFVNGENFDKDLNLNYFYKISMNKFKELKESNIVTEKTNGYQISKDSIMIGLDRITAEMNGFADKRNIDDNYESKLIKSFAIKNWNVNNFGPLTIPIGKIFVLGDFRDNSEDSRFIGFLDKEDIVGVVLKDK